MKIHDRNSFFRYLSFEGAFNTLNSNELWLCSPRLFNDPFELQVNLNPPFQAKDVTRLLSQKIASAIMVGGEFPGSQILNVDQKSQLFHIAREKYSEQELMALLDRPDTTSQYKLDEISRINSEEIRQGLDDIFILCLSTDFHDILMWAHYAAGHTGAVLELRCVEEIDNIFCAARPVRYQDHFPTFGSEQDWHDYIFKGKAINPISIFHAMTLTKSNHWKYENEWRVVVPLPEHRGKGHAGIALKSAEVASVYLGCKITDENRKKIIEVITNRYQTTSVYQARRNDRSFGLDFEEVYKRRITI